MIKNYWQNKNIVYNKNIENKNIKNHKKVKLLARRVLLLQAMLDDINDAADDFPVIDPRNTMWTWEEGLDTFELFGRKEEKLAHGVLPEHNQPDFLLFGK